MNVIKNIILFVLLLSVIVSLHELGHLIAAKIFGVYCKEYSIGMGPKLFSIKGKETEYSLRALPVGGFVAMAGDNDNTLETKVDTTNLPPERTLTGIAKWKRVIIMMAGIMMNMLLAIFIYSMVILNAGTYAVGTAPIVNGVNENSPAMNAGFKAGDIIESVSFENGIKIKPNTYIELISFLNAYDGNGEWTFEVKRAEQSLTIAVTPDYIEESQRYLIGISFANGAIEFADVNIFNCFKYGFEYAFFILRITWSSLLTIFSGKNLNSLSGPVGIYSTVAEVSEQGLDVYLQLMAAILINVGIVNALPLPVFDGGRVLLLIIEMIIGKPLSEKAENFIMNTSVALLLALVLFVTFNDISKLIGG